MDQTQLSKQDARAMAMLLREGFPDSGWSAESLAQTMALQTSLAWGWKKGRVLITFILCQIAADEAEILLMVTHPLYRKKGLAFSLLETAHDYLRDHNVTRLFLEVSVKNEAAINFYTKAGFQIVGQRHQYYARTQESAYIMKK